MTNRELANSFLLELAARRGLLLDPKVPPEKFREWHIFDEDLEEFGAMLRSLIASEELLVRKLDEAEGRGS